MSQPGGFPPPPPPMYPQRPRQNLQQAAGPLGVRPAGTMPYSNSQISNQVSLGFLWRGIMEMIIWHDEQANIKIVCIINFWYL
jgi:hypothetical protein